MTPRLAFPLVALALALSFMPVSTASVDGPCTMLVGGVDLADGTQSVEVPEDGNLTYHVDAPSDIRALRVILHFGPGQRQVFGQEFPAGTRSSDGVVPLDAMQDLATGVYLASAEVDLVDGSCTGDLEVRIPGSLWSTPVGIAAAAAVGAGGIGLLLVILRTTLDAKDIVDTVKDMVAEARNVVPLAADPEGKDGGKADAKGPDDE